jgi:hypothetical protein
VQAPFDIAPIGEVPDVQLHPANDQITSDLGE